MSKEIEIVDGDKDEQQPGSASTDGQAREARHAVADKVFGKESQQAAQDETSDASAASDRLQSDLEEAQGRLLRVQADLDNYRKRVQREQAQERLYAGITLLRDLLPVVDNIHRAIEAAEKSDDAASLLEGFKMVAQQIETVFEQHDCKPIPALGEVFDPNLHEAISQSPSGEYPKGAVMMVTQPGYALHARVVRPSQVIVSSGSADDSTDG